MYEVWEINFVSGRNFYLSKGLIITLQLAHELDLDSFIPSLIIEPDLVNAFQYQKGNIEVGQ